MSARVGEVEQRMLVGLEGKLAEMDRGLEIVRVEAHRTATAEAARVDFLRTHKGRNGEWVSHCSPWLHLDSFANACCHISGCWLNNV